jgi:5,10-methylenetetrahydrofolate reductase
VSAPPPAVDRCPKRMVYGPCGGVRDDGSCEMRTGSCAFPEPVVRAESVTGHPLAALPRVLTDFSAPPYDLDMLKRVSAIVAPSCDAVLVGDHQSRPDFPPTLLGRMLLDTGARPWLTLACRDRNRIVLEQELHGLRHVGVDTVLCVTGDGRAYDVRPDVTQVFDLDGPRLAELATRTGLTAAVPEAPLAPPIRSRPQRLVGKQRSGAAVAVLNHVARPGDVAAFMTAARAAGLTIPVIASVAVYTDAASAAALQNLPGFHLDPDSVRCVLDARDQVAAGIDIAVAEALALLDIEGVEGVNISGAASDRGWEFAASVKADIGVRVREAAR